MRERNYFFAAGFLAAVLAGAFFATGAAFAAGFFAAAGFAAVAFGAAAFLVAPKVTPAALAIFERLALRRATVFLLSKFFFTAVSNSL